MLKRRKQYAGIGWGIHAISRERKGFHMDHISIDEFRLFNNMLSSMPMCFNLFADFRAAVQERHIACVDVLAAIFKTSPISLVDDIVVEMIPQPTCEYIDDKTAWDAAILYQDDRGGKGLASIETKYTDKLGSNQASKEDKKLKLAEELGLFGDGWLEWYGPHHFNQVARNLLLTLAYQRKHGIAHAIDYVLAPEADEEALRVVNELKSRLSSKYQTSIEMLPLEVAVKRGLACSDEFFTEHLNRFWQRYLDLSQIDRL
jgi:hypothetical protein